MPTPAPIVEIYDDKIFFGDDERLKKRRNGYRARRDHFFHIMAVRIAYLPYLHFSSLYFLALVAQTFYQESENTRFHEYRKEIASERNCNSTNLTSN